MNKEPYRFGVKAYIQNANKQVLIVKEVVNNYEFWDLPGGGLEINEEPKKCLERELEEELGIKSVTFDKAAPVEYIEDWSDFLIESGYNKHGIKYIGQKNQVYLIKCPDITIHLNSDELADFAWVSNLELNDYIKNISLINAVKVFEIDN